MQQFPETNTHIPFDARICHQAELKDLHFDLIKAFLHETQSNLLSEIDTLPFEEICKRMQIIQPLEGILRPLNSALMLFNNYPEQFFPYTKIEIVSFHDIVGDCFSEKIFEGPIHRQLQQALNYLKAFFIKEENYKNQDSSKIGRFYNYPYIALKEALSNAVYHKDYTQREPIEVSIKPDRIEILSFSGPLPPLKIEDLKKGLTRIRAYRNRRMGDFLKELGLTEGRCTGILKIHKAMQSNGSPPPLFETDKECRYFLTILPIHPEASKEISKKVEEKNAQNETHRSNLKTHQSIGVFSKQALPISLKQCIDQLGKRPDPKELRSVIVKLCELQTFTAQQLVELLKKKDKKHLVRCYLTPMIKEGELKYLYPDDEDSPNQAYTI